MTPLPLGRLAKTEPWRDKAPLFGLISRTTLSILAEFKRGDRPLAYDGLLYGATIRQKRGNVLRVTVDGPPPGAVPEIVAVLSYELRLIWQRRVYVGSAERSEGSEAAPEWKKEHQRTFVEVWIEAYGTRTGTSRSIHHASESYGAPVRTWDERDNPV